MAVQLDKKRVGERIKKLRLAKKMSQTDLRVMLGISSGNLSDIERGRQYPSAPALVALSEALGCSVDYLLTGKDEVLTGKDLDESDKGLLRTYHQLSPADREEIQMLALYKVKRDTEAKRSEGEEQ